MLSTAVSIFKDFSILEIKNVLKLGKYLTLENCIILF